MNVPFLDLPAQHAPLHGEIIEEWAEILRSAQFVSGERVARFEEAFAAAHDAAHCIAVGNGTMALELPLRALGVGPGDQVAVPANTFIATAEAVSNVGAQPVFVDIDPATHNIDPEALARTMSTHDAIVGTIAVHLYGHPADLDELSRVAGSSGTWLMEDAAQAHLARYKGRQIGTHGVAGAFSFYPGKNLGAPGEGGAVVTNDAALAADVRALRDHGQSEKYESRLIGTNARMMELVAAVLTIKLRHLPEWTERRRTAAAAYRALLADVAGLDLPQTAPWADPVWHLFVVHSDQRQALRDHLTAAGIGTGLHYPIPLHLQQAYRHLGYGEDTFPVAERSARRLLSLPMHEGLSAGDIATVAKCVKDTMGRVGS